MSGEVTHPIADGELIKRAWSVADALDQIVVALDPHPAPQCLGLIMVACGLAIEGGIVNKDDFLEQAGLVWDSVEKQINSLKADKEAGNII